MTNKSSIGKLGEDLACLYLVNRKYKIIDRNFRKPWGELDIIAKDPEDTLVFVEVKTMKKYGNAAIAALLPEDNLTVAKLKKLKKTISLYAGFNPNLIDDEKGWRLDLVAITISGLPEGTYPEPIEGLTDLLKYCEIKHYENIA